MMKQTSHRVTRQNEERASVRADAVRSRSGRRDTVSRTAKLRRPTQTPVAPRPLSSHSTRRTPLIDRRPLCPPTTGPPLSGTFL